MVDKERMGLNTKERWNVDGKSVNKCEGTKMKKVRWYKGVNSMHNEEMIDNISVHCYSFLNIYIR